jgi:hypothetical protein
VQRFWQMSMQIKHIRWNLKKAGTLKTNKCVRNSPARFFFAVPILSMFLFITESGTFAQNNPRLTLLDGSKKQLIVPIRNIQSDYTDNTSKLPLIEYSDSYFAEVSDQIVFQGLSKTFKSVELLTDTNDIKAIYSAIIWSKDEGEVDFTDVFQNVVKEIAAKYTADFVVIPGYCTLKYKTFHQKSWRNARSGSSYERPVSVTAYAEYKIHFFQKDGCLNREGRGNAKSGKPLFYEYFKKRNFDKKIVENSKKKYAPPLLRALSKSIENALNDL